MEGQCQRHLVRGVLAGVAGGLVASWVMNEFMAGPGKKLEESIQTPEEKEHARREEEQQKDAPQEDSTMKVADAVVSTATGGQHLSFEGKQKGGPIVHYTFGALMGGIYGGLAEYLPIARAGFGTSFGSVLFAGADLVAVPALKLAPPPSQEPKSALSKHFAAHIVYGGTTELVRRIVRAVL